ncbi:M48 family metallopeptidase [Massilia solisilvae]|uniref:M48 family metallopeptidase n=1 Tax=Massilia solisilvae TaxID=1811225 RepID=A0ABT2BR82_9BURK|nr:M48 family metallopeptidase [Massilia solisilvae]
MNEEEFGWLVKRLEAQSANSPQAFRARVLLMSVAAYVALFCVLFLNAALLYGAVAWSREHGVNRVAIAAGILGLMALPILYVTLRTLAMRLSPPQGRAIMRADAPVLFELLDKMQAKLKGPTIHHVLVDTDYNAGIVQLPSWGLVGPSVNYLVLGLPFLFGHSTSGMQSVVAHEYGHLCGAHGRLGNWVWRQRLILHKVHERVDAASEASVWYGLLLKPLDAFMPYFDACSFVLRRQHEYEADRTSARLAGADVAAASLVRTELLATWFHTQFWSTLYRQADTRERPGFMPYKSFATALRISHDEWATQERLKGAWQYESGYDDTHPCLRERVEALGQQPALPQPLARSAAVSLLGELANQLAEEFDQAWWRDHGKDWGERYRRVTRSQARLRELDAAPLSALPLHELQELAVLKVEFDSAQAAKPVLAHLLRQGGGPFPKASCMYGQILLDERRREGLDYLAEAARHDRRLAGEALHAGFQFLLAHEGEARAHQWVGQIQQAQAA